MSCFVKETQDWDTERARKHVLDDDSYKGIHLWRGTPLQTFRMVEKDVLFQTRAFHHVVPSNPLSAVDSAKYMQE